MDGDTDRLRGKQDSLAVCTDGPKAYIIKSLNALLFTNYLNLLMLCTPFAVLARQHGGSDGVIFAFSLLAIAPFAERLSFVTEQLALHTNETCDGASLGSPKRPGLQLRPPPCLFQAGRATQRHLRQRDRADRVDVRDQGGPAAHRAGLAARLDPVQHAARARLRLLLRRPALPAPDLQQDGVRAQLRHAHPLRHVRRSTAHHAEPLLPITQSPCTPACTTRAPPTCLPRTSHAYPTHLPRTCHACPGRCSSRRCCSRRTPRSRRARCSGSRAGSPRCCSARAAARPTVSPPSLAAARVPSPPAAVACAVACAVAVAVALGCGSWLRLPSFLAPPAVRPLPRPTPNPNPYVPTHLPACLPTCRYCCYLLFQLHTHRHVFEDSKGPTDAAQDGEEEEEEEEEEAVLGMWGAVFWLAVITVSQILGLPPLAGGSTGSSARTASYYWPPLTRRRGFVASLSLPYP